MTYSLDTLIKIGMYDRFHMHHAVTAKSTPILPEFSMSVGATTPRIVSGLCVG